MTTVTLRPDSTLGSSGTSLTGAATVHAATNDNSDSTYVGINDGYITVGFATTTLPAGAQVRSVTAYARIFVTNFTGGIMNVSWGTSSAQFATWSSISNAPQNTYTLAAQAMNPSGGTWTQADIDDLQMTCAITSTWTGPDGYVYDVWIVVDYNSAPTATGTAPNANTATLKPTFSWTYSDGDGDAQERYRIKVFSSAQISAPGFDPNTSTAYLDSGEVFSSLTSWTCTSNLQNGITYRAYVFVADVGSNGRYNIVNTFGPYAYTTVDIKPPGVPTISSITTQSSDMSFQLAVQDRQNILSTDEAGFETSISTWTAVANCNVARSTAQAENGSASMSMTATSTSQMSAISGYQSNIWGAGGQPYTARASFFNATQARTYRVDIQWYDDSNSLLSTTTGRSFPGTANTWVAAFVTGAPPGTATKAKVVVAVTGHANSEVHYVDNVGLMIYANNMINNPQFEVDSDNNGFADDWSSYTTGTNTVSGSLDTTASYVYSGVSSQKLTLVTGSGYAGIQTLPIAWGVGSYVFYAKIWVETACTIDIFTTSSGSHTQALSAGSWQTVLVNISQASAVTEPIIIRCTASVVMHIGVAQLELGGSFTGLVLNRRTWVRGGALVNYWEIQRSDDSGATWKTRSRLELNNALFNPATDVQLNRNIAWAITGIGDYEAPRNATPWYRVRATVVVDGTALASQWGPWFKVQPANVLPLTGWWFKPIYHPSLGLRLYINDESLTWNSDGNDGVFWPLGRRAAVVISDKIHGEQLDIDVSLLTEADRLALETLRGYEETMLVQSPYGDEFYMRFINRRSFTHMLQPNGSRRGSSKVSLVEVDVP